MKISLQIILADARLLGRGLLPQPFDRHISGKLPRPDNIIQESESQCGDRAGGTIQLLSAGQGRPAACGAVGHSVCKGPVLATRIQGEEHNSGDPVSPRGLVPARLSFFP